MPFTGKKVGVGVGLETTRGVKSSIQYRFPWTDNTFSDKANVEADSGVVDTIVDSINSEVTKQWAEGTIGGQVYPNGICVITRGLEIYAIQCKHYYGRKMVSANEVRDFQGAIDLYEKQNNLTVRGGIFVTSGKSSAKSRETARTLGIALWDKYNWKEKINIL